MPLRLAAPRNCGQLPACGACAARAHGCGTKITKNTKATNQNTHGCFVTFVIFVDRSRVLVVSSRGLVDTSGGPSQRSLPIERDRVELVAVVDEQARVRRDGSRVDG